MTVTAMDVFEASRLQAVCASVEFPTSYKVKPNLHRRRTTLVQSLVLGNCTNPHEAFRKRKGKRGAHLAVRIQRSLTAQLLQDLGSYLPSKSAASRC